MVDTTVNTREIVRNYRKVFDDVRRTKNPAIVVNQKEPEVAIVSIEDLDIIKQHRQRNSAKSALHFVQKMRQLLQEEDLPKDLSRNHDYYLWEAEPQK